MTRRTVSIRRETYDALFAKCQSYGVTVSAVVEFCLASWFAAHGVVPAQPVRKRMGRPHGAKSRKTVERLEQAERAVHSPQEWAAVLAKYPIPSGNESTARPLATTRAAIAKRPSYGAF